MSDESKWEQRYDDLFKILERIADERPPLSSDLLQAILKHVQDRVWEQRVEMTIEEAEQIARGDDV